MKKTFKYLSLCLMLLLSAAFLLGCGDQKDPNEDKRQDLWLEEIHDIEQYKIVRPDKGDGAKNALTALRDTIKEKLNIELKVGTDYSGAVEKEILIGLTSRTESKAAANDLRASDFRIRIIGSKIVIVGGSDVGLERAMDFVLKYCISTERNSFAVPTGAGYVGKGNYISDKISIDGVDISEFKITSKTYGNLSGFANKIMSDVIGIELKTTNSTSNKDSHYIMIDNTGVVADKFSISVEDGNIIIKGSPNSTDYAIDYFCGTYLMERGGKNVELKNGDKFEGSMGKIPIYTKAQLMNVLTTLYNDPNKYVVGQQANYQEMPSTALDVFTEAAGELPGMLGIDFGCYGMYIQNYNSQKWSQAICEIVDYVSKGGIIEISSHMDNPADPSAQVRGKLGEATTQDELNALFEELITEGTEMNKEFKEHLDIDGRFLRDLRDNGVPVVWRPLHEMNGSWFWYCVTANGITADSEVWANVWRYIHNYYTKDLGLDNLIWVFSPNVADNALEENGKTMSPIYCYPGNEYVDMVGIDWYFSSVNKFEPAGYADLLDVTGYIGGLAEFGPTGDVLLADAEKDQKQEEMFNCMDANEFLQNIAASGSKFSYVLSWAGKQSFARFGKLDEFMKLDHTIGAKELKTIFDGIK